MSIIGSYRSSGVNSVSGSIFSESIYNFTGWKPSGISEGNIMGTALYVWSGTVDFGNWIPLRREWLTD